MKLGSRRRSLSAMITVRAGLAVLIGIGIGSILIAVMLERSAKAQAETTGAIVARAIAADVQARFERSIGTVAGMRDAMAGLHGGGLADRAAHSRIIRATLAQSPELIATWVGWDADAFDRRDARFARTAGHDATGRFVPYWHRSGTGLALSPLEDYTVPGAGDYYLQPHGSGRPTLIEPYLYPIDGRPVLITSIALPIREGGRTVGVAGADVSLDALQTALRSLRLPFGGTLALISGKGKYLFATDRRLLGKAAAGSDAAVAIVDDPARGTVLQVESPVALSGIDAGWRVRVDLPMANILANARRIEWMLAGFALVMVVGLALILRDTARRVVGRPLEALRSEMAALAQGDLSPHPTGATPAVEVAEMQRAVQVFRDNAVQKQAVDAAKAQADADQRRVVETVSAHLSALSNGDLGARITADFPGDYARLKSDFNDALGRLGTLIGQVSESTAAISTGSHEIAQASEDLARRTESNAASLEQTSASVTQMDARLRASAQSATDTAERADVAIRTVGVGRAVTDEAVQAMGRVADSATGIDSVIEGLDKIAFQTRVLAMNAAVEAGRAGEAGRGFAVVADLVSALAMRSEEEAKRAREQLTVTRSDIGSAVGAVQKVDDALAAISGEVGQVHHLLAAMASDNQAQAQAISQISTAITAMDRTTQQNAAMVEQTSAAARNLASEIENLADQAGRFTVTRERSSGHAGAVLEMA